MNSEMEKIISVYIVGSKCNHCDNGWVDYIEVLDCSSCWGSGMFDGNKCRACKGTGEYKRQRRKFCNVCRGSGKN